VQSASAIQLYRHMLTARQVDEREQELVNRGEAFFHVSGAGHEGTAALNRHLISQDVLHCHYRDKALVLARGITPPAFFHALLCTDRSHSAGRQMSAHMSDRPLNVLSITGPIGNSALQACGVAEQVRGRSERPIVLCSMGDGSSQQGEVMEAIAEAVRWELPVLFLIQDNRYSISTRTRGRTWYSLPTGEPESFYGLPIHRLEGRDVIACDEPLGRIVAGMRRTRRPALVVLYVERLGNHTNADDEKVYRPSEEIEAVRLAGDPIHVLRQKLMDGGLSEAELAKMEQEIRREVWVAAEEARHAEEPKATRSVKCQVPERLKAIDSEYRGHSGQPQLTMAEALRSTLHARMAKDPRVTLYGEDIEDPKGDVFGVTRGLTQAFAGRVRNSPVSESTIVGTSIGRALAGGCPVAFIQFADFLPLAFNQIATELGSMFWRTNGAWSCPVIVMVACGGYRPGLGPFHAHTLESIAAHVPGVDVCMPSFAADAAGMLNAAFESARPTLFFYPKSRLNDREQTTSADVERQLVPLGHSRRLRAGRNITLVGWGSTVQHCEKAADALLMAGCTADVIDLRWLSPWDEKAVCESVRKTGRLLVVHEDNHTCGFGAEIVATVAEQFGRVACRRVTRADAYVPCHFGNQLEVLPSFRRTLDVAAEMLELEINWTETKAASAGKVTVKAVGSSPADEQVFVAELAVKVGQHVAAGDLLACLECDKALFDLTSPVAGVIDAIHLSEGDKVQVGAPLLTIFGNNRATARQPVREEPGRPTLRRRDRSCRRVELLSESEHQGRPLTVGLSMIYPVEGRDSLTNADLIERFPGETEESILARTGIRRRPIVADGQDAVTMAAEAAARALAEEKLQPRDLDLIICSTGTPIMTSPSTACLVLHRLCGGKVEVPAYDISAACTGYLYALGAAWDYLQSQPDRRVMVLTTEALSTRVNKDDFGTAALFGDAASATIVYGAAHAQHARMRLHRPVLSARAEDGSALCIPLGGNGSFIHMHGRRVFAEAVRGMAAILERACNDHEITTGDLDLIIPHQANGRIIEAVRTRLRCPSERVWNDLLDRGNTSSSTIPFALASVTAHKERTLRTIGLCAFGAGFTFGAAIVELPSL
jgi:2-oxoisovalerate dehydrogenase E1 component